VIDPFSEETGLRLPKLEADIVLVTHNHQDHNNIKAVSGSPFLISGPGEYEVKNIFIQGIPSWHDEKGGEERGENTIFVLETEEMRICHLGDLGQKELTSEQLEQIGSIDILMIPIGGVYTISAKESIKIMSQIEPKIIIPMHYQIPKLKLKLDGLDKFLKIMGIKTIEPLNKFTIKKKDLSEEEAKIIVLKP
jgi:L-ascorbate metabolism protein UlaG (beta-lactamase superfamily)